MFANQERILEQWNQQRIALIRERELAEKSNAPLQARAKLTRDIHYIEARMEQLQAKGVLEP